MHFTQVYQRAAGGKARAGGPFVMSLSFLKAPMHWNSLSNSMFFPISSTWPLFSEAGFPTQKSLVHSSPFLLSSLTFFFSPFSFVERPGLVEDFSPWLEPGNITINTEEILLHKHSQPLQKYLYDLKI